MAILDLLSVLFCLLAVLLYIVAASVFFKGKASWGIPAHSLTFAALSFVFLAAAALSCLLAAYAVFLPAMLFLSAACLALHFATARPASPPELSNSMPQGIAPSSLLDLESQAMLDIESQAMLDLDGQAMLDIESQAMLDLESQAMLDLEAQAMLDQASEAEAMNIEDEAWQLDDFDFPLHGEALRQEDVQTLLEAGQEIIAQAAKSMAESPRLDELLGFANRLLIERTGADGGIVLMVDDYEDFLDAKAFSGQFPPPYRLHAGIPRSKEAVEESLRGARIPFKGNVLGEVALSGTALCIKDGTDDPRVYLNGTEDFLRPGSYIIAPLADKNEVSGVAALARLSNSEPFSEKDFMAARILASYAAVAVNSAYSFHELVRKANIERGSEAASEIQQAMRPAQLPELPEVGFGFFSRSAKGVCADYCDVIFARRDRIALAMADVAGRGIASGMLMTGLRAILHLVTNTTQSSATILDWINKGIAGKSIADSFAALAYVSYSMETRELEYSNAGQQPVLLWRASEKRLEALYIDSAPVGIDRNSEYNEIKLTAAPGDIIILLTDGLLEALNASGLQYGFTEWDRGGIPSLLSYMDGSSFVPPRLSRIISENAAASAADIAAAVRADLDGFMEGTPLYDDQSLLVMKVKA